MDPSSSSIQQGYGAESRQPLLASPAVPVSGSVVNSTQLKPKSSVYETGTIVDNDEEVKHNKLGVINGCYVPCLLNIMGIVLFERLAWGIGQQGVGGVLLIFLIAECQAILTVLSLSAMVSNGSMRGGGSYFMISRTLGPEFGGSIGILFYAAYCVSVAFYCTGFAEEVVGTWWKEAENHPWMVVGFASIVLSFALIVALMGAGWFTKINVPLFCVQAFAIFITMIAAFFRGDFKLPDGDYHHKRWQSSRLHRNWRTKCESSWDCYSFQGVFGVLFPAATGIMEGANLSGDQKDPAFAIPYGTLAAVFTSIITYGLLIMAFGGSYNEDAMINRLTIFQETAYGDWGRWMVILGIMISASSSALGALFGGSRVLQAIARDRLFPKMDWLGYGSTDGDEPRVAVLFTWVLAQLLCLIGSVNLIAPIATAIFCMSYATVNISTFLLQISGTPNWRPDFEYFTWHTCLLGFIINMTVMFYVDYKFGAAALFCEVVVFIYLMYFSTQRRLPLLPTNNNNTNDNSYGTSSDESTNLSNANATAAVWGDVTQSVIFHQVRKYLLKLDERKHHAKLWRPSILLFVDNSDLALIDFCNNLKKGGLYVVGSVLQGDFDEWSQSTLEIRRKWFDFLKEHQIKAFAQIAVTPTPCTGYENLLLLCGLGAMQPNTCVWPMISPSEDDDDEDEDIDAASAAAAIVSSADSGVSGVVSKDDVLKQKKRLFVGPDKKRRLSIFGDSGLSRELQSRVVDSPSDMDPCEYARLIRHVLDAEKNVVITCNFDKLDSDLIASDTLRQRIETERKFRTVKLDGVVEEEHPAFSSPADEEEKYLHENDDIDELVHFKDQPSSSKKPGGKKSSDSAIEFTSQPVTESPSDRSGSFWTARNLISSPSDQPERWVDVWMFASEYTYDLAEQAPSTAVRASRMSMDGMENGSGNGGGSGMNHTDTVFPMLLMQLAHVLLLNKRWSKVAKCKLRVFLIVNDDWGPNDEQRYKKAAKELRLKIARTVPLKASKYNKPPDWPKKGELSVYEKNELRQYFEDLNETIRQMSGNESMLSLIRMPPLPHWSFAKDNAKLLRFYFDCLRRMTEGLGPTCLVATGETIPVISVDI